MALVAQTLPRRTGLTVRVRQYAPWSSTTLTCPICSCAVRRVEYDTSGRNSKAAGVCDRCSSTGTGETIVVRWALAPEDFSTKTKQLIHRTFWPAELLFEITPVDGSVRWWLLRVKCLSADCALTKLLLDGRDLDKVVQHFPGETWVCRAILDVQELAGAERLVISSCWRLH